MKRVSWLYFLGTETQKDEIFIYGLSLPTSFNGQAINSNPIKLNKAKIGDKNLYLFYGIVDYDAVNITNNSQISFNNLYKNTTHAISNNPLVVYDNHFIQNDAGSCLDERPESPIGSTVEMNVYYTNQFYEYDNSRYKQHHYMNELLQICNILHEDTNQSFTNYTPHYSKRIGCFEFGKIQEFAEDNIPFSIHVEKIEQDEHLRNYYFEKKDYNDNVIVHLIVYSDLNDILLDEVLLTAGINDKYYFSKMVKDCAKFQFWVFNANGKLLHYNKLSWIKSISMNMNIMQNSVKINDKDTVGLYSSMPINVDFSNKKADFINRTSQAIYDILSESGNKDIKNGRFFSKSNSDSINDLFQYINEITNQSHVEITIIDPFISVHSLEPLMQFENASIKINIISCWKKYNPDNDNEIMEITDIVSKTTTKLQDIKNGQYGLPISNATWYNLSSEKFHDRYILIKAQDVESLYLLSNSLNNLLKDYDFCIVPLQGSTKSKAILSIKDLLQNCNQNTVIYPTICKK